MKIPCNQQQLQINNRILCWGRPRTTRTLIRTHTHGNTRHPRNVDKRAAHLIENETHTHSQYWQGQREVPGRSRVLAERAGSKWFEVVAWLANKEKEEAEKTPITICKRMKNVCGANFKFITHTQSQHRARQHASGCHRERERDRASERVRELPNAGDNFT